MSRVAITLILAISFALTSLGALSLLANGDSVQAIGADYPNCRLGVGVQKNPITTYPYAPMRFGWYVDWRAPLVPNKPAGMDYYFTIRVKQDKSGSVYLPSYQITPTLSFAGNGLGPIVQANPGAVWIIGNEPDRVYYQDESLPDMYATIYHDAYTFIKGIDPTARLAIGGVIQPTPVRLQYLDAILAAYQAKYGRPMPIDVWNIHLYILQETALSWGASIPPGINVLTGTMYTIPQHVDINVFSSLVHNMRSWMKSRGYQNTPLILTEYGVLFPLDILASNGIDYSQVQAYLTAVVSYLDTALDSSIGYPADNYRLVQQAALYSLDDDSTDGSGGFRWGSFLFRSTAPYTKTTIGAHYQAILSDLLPVVDLIPYSASTDPDPLLALSGNSVTTTFKLLVSNAGNASPPISATVRFFDVTDGVAMQVGSDVTLAPFTGCGAQREASVSWPNLSVGLHQMRAVVDPANQIDESVESNNVVTFTVLVGAQTIYLPVAHR